MLHSHKYVSESETSEPYSQAASTQRWNLRTQQSPAGESHDYRDVIETSVFKMFSHTHPLRSCEWSTRLLKMFRSLWNAKLGFPTFPVLKSVFEKLHFRAGLVWTVGLTVEKKLRFQISPAWCRRGLLRFFNKKHKLKTKTEQNYGRVSS